MNANFVNTGKVEDQERYKKIPYNCLIQSSAKLISCFSTNTVQRPSAIGERRIVGEWPEAVRKSGDHGCC
jgi:hypothetical protein